MVAGLGSPLNPLYRLSRRMYIIYLGPVSASSCRPESLGTTAEYGARCVKRGRWVSEMLLGFNFGRKVSVVVCEIDVCWVNVKVDCHCLTKSYLSWPSLVGKNLNIRPETLHFSDIFGCWTSLEEEEGGGG